MKKITGYTRRVLFINILVVISAITLWIMGRNEFNYFVLFGLLLIFDAFFLTSHRILKKNTNDKNFNNIFMIYTVVKLLSFSLIFFVLVYYFPENKIFNFFLIFFLYFLFTFNETKYLVANFKGKQ